MHRYVCGQIRARHRLVDSDVLFNVPFLSTVREGVSRAPTFCSEGEDGFPPLNCVFGAGAECETF